MDSRQDSTIEIEVDEFEAIMALLRFLKTRNYGEFNVTLTVNQKTQQREAIIKVTDNTKMRFKVVSFE